MNFNQASQRPRHSVVAAGKFCEVAVGDITPGRVLILVKRESKSAFESYCIYPALADLHTHRESVADNHIWQLFDKLENLRPIL